MWTFVLHVKTLAFFSDHLLSCIMSSENHVVARFDTPIACTANNIFIRLSLARRIASKGPHDDKGISSLNCAILSVCRNSMEAILRVYPLFRNDHFFDHHLHIMSVSLYFSSI